MKVIIRHLISGAAFLSLALPAPASTTRISATHLSETCAASGTTLNTTARTATRFLKAVPASATLARLKRLLPAGTRFSKVEDTQLGPWTWHVIHFSGPLAGGLVFANNRRAAGMKQGLDEDKPADKKRLERMAVLRPSDPVHYVEVFLGGEATAETPTAIRRETKSHVDALSRYLGVPSKKEYTGNGDGVASYGWLAEWHLSHKRAIWFFTTTALLSSGTRPLLTLEFPYAHVYRE